MIDDELIERWCSPTRRRSPGSKSGGHRVSAAEGELESLKTELGREADLRTGRRSITAGYQAGARIAEAKQPCRAPGQPRMVKERSTPRHRRGRQPLDRHPGVQADRRGNRKARRPGAGTSPPGDRPRTRCDSRRLDAVVRARQGMRTPPTNRLVHLSRAHRRRQDRSGPVLWPSSCSMTSGRWCASTCRSTRRSTTSPAAVPRASRPGHMLGLPRGRRPA